MSMTDPIADLLTRIRNGHTARHSEVTMPSSRMKLAIVKILEQEGYVEGHETEQDDTVTSVYHGVCSIWCPRRLRAVARRRYLEWRHTLFRIGSSNERSASASSRMTKPWPTP